MKKLFKNQYFLIGLALALGLLIGRWTLSENEEHVHAMSEGDGVATVWTCSMHPQIRQNEPGQCPICGMDLIPASQEESEDAALKDAIKMSPTAMQIAQVVTTKVGTASANVTLSLNGNIQENEKKVYQQTAHFPGRIESLQIDFEGALVKKGQQIARIYAPSLQTAQRELLEAYQMREEQPALLAAAKQKLANWKISNAQIQAIIDVKEIKEYFPLLADFSGYVSSKKVSEGDYVKEGAILYEVADLSSVWAMLDVYEADLAKVNVGDEVSISAQAYPSKSWSGKISYIDPQIDPKTRVAQARVELLNEQGLLKPALLIQAKLTNQKPGSSEALVIPASAILWTGKRSIVYVQNKSESGIYFSMREIGLGNKIGEQYQVIEGLEPGEEIAVNGVFSIDAAAQLADKPSMMNTEFSEKWALGEQDSKKLSQLVHDYLDLKDALVNDDLGNAKKYATKVHGYLSKLSLEIEQDEVWKNLQKSMQSAIVKISNASKLELARDHFKSVSDDIIALIQNTGPIDHNLYIQHCPMADSNKGADWLSIEEEILNPYFGASMLSCGEVSKQLLIKKGEEK